MGVYLGMGADVSCTTSTDMCLDTSLRLKGTGKENGRLQLRVSAGGADIR